MEKSDGSLPRFPGEHRKGNEQCGVKKHANLRTSSELGYEGDEPGSTSCEFARNRCILQDVKDVRKSNPSVRPSVPPHDVPPLSFDRCYVFHSPRDYSSI